MNKAVCRVTNTFWFTILLTQACCREASMQPFGPAGGAATTSVAAAASVAVATAASVAVAAAASVAPTRVDLRESLKSKDPSRRSAAVKQLGEIYAIPDLLEILTAPDPELRRGACDALRAGAALWINVYNFISDDATAREMGRGALLRMYETRKPGTPGTPSTPGRDGLQELVRLYSDHQRSEGDRARTRDELIQVGEAEKAEVVAALLFAMGDPDDEVRVRALSALAIVGLGVHPNDTFVTGLKALRTADVQRRLRYVDSMRRAGGLHAALIALQDSDARVREQAARVLALMRNADAVPGLTEALDDRRPEVRRQAASALEAIRTTKATGANRTNRTATASDN